MNREEIDYAIRNLEDIVKRVPATILDHHLLRDQNWMTTAQSVFDTASSVGHTVLTAAEFTGAENNLLEAQRKNLYETEPPSREFTKWMRMPIQKRKLAPPPI